MNIPQHWRLKGPRYNLVGCLCGNCSLKTFPPREICPECGAPLTKDHEFQFSGRGEVFSFSTVYHAPASHQEQAPYTVALIKLAEGPMITAQLTDVDRGDIRIGMPVEMVTRVLQINGERGMIIYGYKFRPLELERIRKEIEIASHNPEQE